MTSIGCFLKFCRGCGRASSYNVHDIFFPFEYPDAWLDWGFNEMYLLRAFLSYNNVFQIMFFNCLVWREHPEIVRRYFPEGAKDRPGSIWLRRVT